MKEPRSYKFDPQYSGLYAISQLLGNTNAEIQLSPNKTNIVHLNILKLFKLPVDRETVPTINSTQAFSSEPPKSRFFATLIHTKKLIHCVAILTILYGNHYPPRGEFKGLTSVTLSKNRFFCLFQQFIL